jgi:hypothetical protein
MEALMMDKEKRDVALFVGGVMELWDRDYFI